MEQIVYTVEQLAEIFRKHALWREGEEGGERAGLTGAGLCGANLFLIGQDIRGYLHYGSRNDDNVFEYLAGCRHFVGISAARAHWADRRTENLVLHEDCLSLVDRAEHMAKARGWKLESEQ